MKSLEKLKSLQLLLVLLLVLSIRPVSAIASTTNDINQKIFENTITKAYEQRTKSIVNNVQSNNLKNYYIQKNEIYNFEMNRYKSFENTPKY
ncbi:hypothetical protein [Clostridium sp. KNHs214]|uniref:hypothetical protein n=1 Tax=Clostridium sp. KNHs214 TaxID=1540257 RepID=UPI000556C5E0|nr:hypothetical protein [Clostridium sp. KNHs214]